MWIICIRVLWGLAHVPDSMASKRSSSSGTYNIRANSIDHNHALLISCKSLVAVYSKWLAS